jgi:hypothetical protein
MLVFFFFFFFFSFSLLSNDIRYLFAHEIAKDEIISFPRSNLEFLLCHCCQEMLVESHVFLCLPFDLNLRLVWYDYYFRSTLERIILSREIECLQFRRTTLQGKLSRKYLLFYDRFSCHFLSYWLRMNIEL